MKVGLHSKQNRGEGRRFAVVTRLGSKPEEDFCPGVPTGSPGNEGYGSDDGGAPRTEYGTIDCREQES